MGQFIFWLILLTALSFPVLSIERLPTPLEDESYDTFKKALLEGTFHISRNCKPLIKKIYRLFQTKRYAVKMMTDPITEESSEVIVSIKH